MPFYVCTLNSKRWPFSHLCLFSDSSEHRTEVEYSNSNR